MSRSCRGILADRGDRAWRSGVEAATNLPVGEIVVQFRELSGWAVPDTNRVSITPAEPTVLRVRYGAAQSPPPTALWPVALQATRR
jgi:hypothetical protein